MKIERLTNNPIITPEMSPRLGDNINGPSLIRLPDWVEEPLGRYYLYFAHHKGDYIRLAYSDSIKGPWSIYEPGALTLDASTCFDHIASPDVHVDAANRQLRMYFHGPAYRTADESDGLENDLTEAGPWMGTQRTKLALSTDGITFQARPDVLGAPYFRVFQWKGQHFSLSYLGILHRSPDGLMGWERGSMLFTERFRHPAVHLQKHTLHVFYSNVFDRPERILHSSVDLRPDWTSWTPSEPVTVLEPETDYEGVGLPLEPSARGLATEPVRQLRDPAIFEEAGRLYLLYSVAGEQGIAMARLLDL